MSDVHGVPETETFVTHLECGYEGDRYEADTLQNLSKAGKPLLVRYDLEGHAVEIELLGADLASAGASEPLNPPVPPGRDPGSPP